MTGPWGMSFRRQRERVAWLVLAHKIGRDLALFGGRLADRHTFATST